LRLLRHLLLALVIIVLVAAAVVVLVLRSLDTGFVKERLRHIVGLDLDYADARVAPLSGLQLRGLSVP
jgi:hypothetical protein